MIESMDGLDFAKIKVSLLVVEKWRPEIVYIPESYVHGICVRRDLAGAKYCTIESSSTATALGRMVTPLM
jgi:dTDP-4-dehydrorhamnose 3,5-epimerase-like enzyme